MRNSFIISGVLLERYDSGFVYHKSKIGWEGTLIDANKR